MQREHEGLVDLLRRAIVEDLDVQFHLRVVSVLPDQTPVIDGLEVLAHDGIARIG